MAFTCGEATPRGYYAERLLARAGCAALDREFPDQTALVSAVANGAGGGNSATNKVLPDYYRDRNEWLRMRGAELVF